jgi:glyoxylase-like metal-dependent hydrolase (beta-lactamase superfamily II)
VRVHCLTTGRVRPKQGQRGVRRYLPGGWRDQTLPVNVFAIEHPGGICLFDAGQTARAAEDGYFPRWYPFFRLAAFELGPEDEAAPQLQRLGLDPNAVRWVVLSHLHTDHVGGVDGFPQAEVLVSRLEWERAQGLGGRLRGYLPQYWPRSIEPTLVDFPRAPVGPFPSHLDLAGDGRLVLVPTPGHTPGHLSMLVREGERGFLCAGDLCHSPRELAVTAPAIDAFCHETGVAVLATHDEGAGQAVEK